jgi:septal ring factor EnvC (AmiA/AmiB activator)
VLDNHSVFAQKHIYIFVFVLIVAFFGVAHDIHHQSTNKAKKVTPSTHKAEFLKKAELDKQLQIQETNSLNIKLIETLRAEISEQKNNNTKLENQLKSTETKLKTQDQSLKEEIAKHQTDNEKLEAQLKSAENQLKAQNLPTDEPKDRDSIRSGISNPGFQIPNPNP